ncbi:hypothetical protein GCM10007161_06140 [Ignatzschineria indica]|nr:glycosyltransferase [Ignatzschineria indica]GGZ77686.1 hypothetical protein GCM10007161_06140 [Ignatzschineria indica]
MERRKRNDKLIEYLLIDPFNSYNSGVTQYILLSDKILKSKGTRSFVLAKDINETLEGFCCRIATFVKENTVLEIEAPETLATTRYLTHEKIHIRLHLSRQVGRYLQGFPIDYKSAYLEQNEINKAYRVSAPSQIALFLSKKIFNIKKCDIYPNPVEAIPNKISCFQGVASSNGKIYFIGRGDSLKGLMFLKIFKVFENNIICVGDSNLLKFLNKNNLNVKFINGKDRKYLSLLTSSDVVIIPSLFETWSMVAVESLTRSVKVVTWNHLGFCEFFYSPLLFKANFPNEDEFIDLVKKALCFKVSDKLVMDMNCNINNINKFFFKGVTENYFCFKNRYYDEVLIRNIKNISKKGRKNRFKSLTRKFFASPIQFWRDSFVVRFLKKIKNKK